MKKFIAVLLALLIISSAFVVIAGATEDTTPPADEVVVEEEAEDTGILVTSWKQLKLAFIFKIIDKLFVFFRNLLGGSSILKTTVPVSA